MPRPQAVLFFLSIKIRSFPSGHTSFAFAGSTFCALYSFYWLGKIRSNTIQFMKLPGYSLRISAFFLWLVPAIYVGISRTQVNSFSVKRREIRGWFYLCTAFSSLTHEPIHMTLLGCIRTGREVLFQFRSEPLNRELNLGIKFDPESYQIIGGGIIKWIASQQLF